MSAVNATVCTAARVNAARFSAVGCRRYAAPLAAVGAAFYATARENSARFSAVGVGVILSI